MSKITLASILFNDTSTNLLLKYSCSTPKKRPKSKSKYLSHSKIVAKEVSKSLIFNIIKGNFPSEIESIPNVHSGKKFLFN
ncbi:MAG: hypothetical protein LRZ98_00095 [Candidatus Pacebacteria bacterium]|nr:hypothetical protein [Candidatus Paceibacterota bacterium]